MKTVQAIIELHGGLDALRAKYISIENPPYMQLVIEHIGFAPQKLRLDEAAKTFKVPLISVAHYGKRNGDALRDPDMVFHVHVIAGRIVAWTPRSWRNDYAGIEQEVFVDGPDGQIRYKPKLLRQFRSFAATWDRNIRQQHFKEAYIKQHRPHLDARLRRGFNERSSHDFQSFTQRTRDYYRRAVMPTSCARCSAWKCRSTGEGNDLRFLHGPLRRTLQDARTPTRPFAPDGRWISSATWSPPARLSRSPEP